MLSIEGLQVEIGGKTILKDINLEIKPGETHVLFGPNGTGKTSLLMTIMGYSQFKITNGRIVFKGVDITNLPINERAKLGIGMSYQRPPTIHGLKTRQLVRICAGDGADIDEMAQQVNFENFLERDINAGFSGGEIKRSELLQLMAQNPDLLLFDEPESGVDMENIALVGKVISQLVGKSPIVNGTKSILQKLKENNKMGLIITHTGYIMNYVPIDMGHVLYDGLIGCTGNPSEMLQNISKCGYEECAKCLTETN